MPDYDRPRRRRDDDDDDDDRPRRRDRDRDEEEADERPRRRRRDEDDADDPPRRRRYADDDDRPRRSGKKSGGAGLVVGIGLAVLLLVVAGGAVMWFAIARVGDAKARVHDSNNLKQISLGMHNYENVTGTFPPADGGLSWRYHVLPYVEQGSVYQAMNPREPWDGPANRRFAATRIPPFVSRTDPSGMADTRYRVFVGPGTLYEPGKPPLRFPEMTDGSSNTILIAEANEAVPWPQPKELPYDRTGPLPRLGGPNKGGFLVSMADGSVRFVSDKTSADVIRGGIEPRDGKPFLTD